MTVSDCADAVGELLVTAEAVRELLVPLQKQWGS